MARKYNRPPLTKKGQKTTDRPPLVSCGAGELSILVSMSMNPKKPFNRRGFASKNNLSPSTVYDRLKRLVSKGLVDRVSFGVYLITDKGQAYSEAQKKGGRIVSGGMSKKSFISQHSNRFVLDIVDRNKFEIGSLCKLGSYEIVKMQNWSYAKVSNSDAVVTVNPKQVVIYVEEIVAGTVRDSCFKTFDVAVKYARKLRDLGLKIPSIRLEVAHYAKVQSVLSEVLVKRLGRYELNLDDGSKFWIDFSGDNLEDETDSVKLRERLDEVLNDLSDSGSVFSDVDKLKEIVADLVKLQLLQTYPSRHPSQKNLDGGSYD